MKKRIVTRYALRLAMETQGPELLPVNNEEEERQVKVNKILRDWTLVASDVCGFVNRSVILI